MTGAVGWMRWHGVVTPSAERTASQKPAQSQIEAAAQTVCRQRLMWVLGAGGLEAAGGPRRRHQQGRGKPAVRRDRAQCGRQRWGAKPILHRMPSLSHIRILSRRLVLG